MKLKYEYCVLEKGVGKSNFSQQGILLCAVVEVNKLPLQVSAEKKQFIDWNHMANPETLCTIFVSFDFAQDGTSITGWRLEGLQVVSCPTIL